MHSVINPQEAAILSRRWAVAMFPICLAAPVLGMTGPMFAAGSTVVNGAYYYYSHGFYNEQNQEKARKLFFMSLLYLPLLSLVMIADRKSDWKKKKNAGGDCEDDDVNAHELEHGSIVVSETH
eukprot:GFYU01066024.1.p1 GENE.GFYU01066024.1~~GFYU01066024.1.p1  ORF type:complete len:123 (+),score=37.96 GFYU01066024.1:2-370(+)